MDIFFITLEQGLLIVDVPAQSQWIFNAIQFWFLMFVIDFVLNIIKRIPFL